MVSACFAEMIRKRRETFRNRSGISTIIGTLIFVLILMIGLTTIITIFGYYNNYNNQLLQYDHTVAQQDQTSLSVSGLSFGASPTTIGSSTAYSGVPITLTNSQTSATPATFQQKITFNPSTYSSLEASNLGNIRFCSNSVCSTELYAWLESCSPSCTTSATSASVWVKLTAAIPANGGTLTIYMIFESTSTNFDGIYWGETPTLSGTYGQYDNGANIFNFYDNFAGTTLSGLWTQLSSHGTFTVNNGLTIALTKSTGYAFIYSDTTFSYPMVAETDTTSGYSILGVATTPSSGLNGFNAPYNGYSLNWVGGKDYMSLQTSSGGTTLDSPTQASFPSGIWQVTWSATGTEYFSDGAGITYSGANSGATIANYVIYIGQPGTQASSTVHVGKVESVSSQQQYAIRFYRHRFQYSHILLIPEEVDLCTGTLVGIL